MSTNLSALAVVPASVMAPMAVPPAGAMPSQTRRVLNPQVGSFYEAFRKREELIAQANVRNITGCMDLPIDDFHRRGLVQRLWDAMFNLVDVAEKHTSQHYLYMADETKEKDGTFTQKIHFSDDEVEVMAWTLLGHVEDAQQGICRIPPWYTTEGPVYKAYPSFHERFNDVEDALRQSKSCCCSLFSTTEFIARLAWNPYRELNRKASNRELNSIKNNVQTVGLQVVRDEDVKLNEAGELLDKASALIENGKKYAGQKKNGKGSGVNKRNLQSRKSEFARRFSTPDVRAKLEREITQAKEDQSTPSDSHTLVADITPALPVRTSAEPSPQQDQWTYTEPQAYLGQPIPTVFQGPQTVGPQTVGPQTVGPQTVEQQTVEPHTFSYPQLPQKPLAACYYSQPYPESQVPEFNPNYNPRSEVAPRSHKYSGMPGDILKWANTIENGSQDGYPNDVVPLANSSQQNQAVCQSQGVPAMSGGAQEEAIPDESSFTSGLVFQESNNNFYDELFSDQQESFDAGDMDSFLNLEYDPFNPQ
ncbi:hypothetical protein F4801DRAFT_585013 [Xylaria longipes]|nr:hypothetical protein F4801DRAFT_585013 [Xylaria longipes]RYC58395.1 hypothetical protein CHU98_g7813 [Xylaria longipes]